MGAEPSSRAAPDGHFGSDGRASALNSGLLNRTHRHRTSWLVFCDWSHGCDRTFVAGLACSRDDGRMAAPLDRVTSGQTDWRPRLQARLE